MIKHGWDGKNNSIAGLADKGYYFIHTLEKIIVPFDIITYTSNTVNWNINYLSFVA